MTEQAQVVQMVLAPGVVVRTRHDVVNLTVLISVCLLERLHPTLMVEPVFVGPRVGPVGMLALSPPGRQADDAA
jgi:hypothetical protein